VWSRPSEQPCIRLTYDEHARVVSCTCTVFPAAGRCTRTRRTCGHVRRPLRRRRTAPERVIRSRSAETRQSSQTQRRRRHLKTGTKALAKHVRPSRQVRSRLHTASATREFSKVFVAQQYQHRWFGSTLNLMSTSPSIHRNTME
jgi:hypothetical protein